MAICVRFRFINMNYQSSNNTTYHIIWYWLNDHKNSYIVILLANTNLHCSMNTNNILLVFEEKMSQCRGRLRLKYNFNDICWSMCIVSILVWKPHLWIVNTGCHFFYLHPFNLRVGCSLFLFHLFLRRSHKLKNQFDIRFCFLSQISTCQCD